VSPVAVRSAREGLVALHAVLVAAGGPLADALVPAPETGFDDPGPAQVAAAGPRACDAQTEWELLIEMILEGARLHYGEPVLVRPADPDLRLLLGDQLYALGLSRLAALGDLEAVRELADVISLVAQAHAEEHPERAQAVWEAGAVALGWGGGELHEAAKGLAASSSDRAVEALRAAVPTSASPAGPASSRFTEP
jgi:hypothetical protein